MYLVDTSVWIDHFRHTNKKLVTYLEADDVNLHPMIIGELACGSLKNRSEILSSLKALPLAEVATDDDVLAFIEERGLYAKGIGWVDVHLLASALLSDCELFTLDKVLYRTFVKLAS